MTNWQLLCRQLHALGADVVFGLPGSQNAELFSELGRGKLAVVTCTSELAAGFAAVGYAARSGRPGVLVTIAGPGFCFAAAPLVEARHDSLPLLHVVVRSRVQEGRGFQLQDINHPRIAEDLAGAVVEVTSPADLGGTISDAWHRCLLGEPGPVVVVVDSEILNASADVRVCEPSAPVRNDVPADIPAIASDLDGRSVLLFAGRGAWSARAELGRIAAKRGWAVMTTTSGRGFLPESSAETVRTDMASSAAVNALVAAADVVLAVGVKFSHNGSFGFQLQIPAEKLIHVDASPSVLQCNYQARVAVAMPAEDFATALAAALRGAPEAIPITNVDGLAASIDASRPDPAYEPVFEPETSAERFFASLQAAAPDGAVYVTDSGYHQMLVRNYLVVDEPGQLIVPTNFQSMGFGLSAAIGAAIAAPGKTVIAIIGDGGLQMSAMELLTARKLGLDLKVVVFDDGFYGLIRRQQTGSGIDEFGVDLAAPDYSMLARSLGVAYVGSETAGDDLFVRIFGQPGPMLVRQGLRDSPATEKRNARQRLKGRVRRTVGDRLIRGIKDVLPGRKGSDSTG